MKILVDMNLSPLWVQFLVANGIQAVHWSSIGKPNAADSEILEYAAYNKFVVFTHDLDFGTLLSTRKSRGPSVIQVRTQDVLPSSIGAVVLAAIDVTQDHLGTGAVLTIDLEKSRIRLLPI